MCNRRSSDVREPEQPECDVDQMDKHTNKNESIAPFFVDLLIKSQVSQSR